MLAAGKTFPRMSLGVGPVVIVLESKSTFVIEQHVGQFLTAPLQRKVHRASLAA